MNDMSKAETIAQAVKDIYDELRMKFDKDTAKELLIASMPAITEDIIKPTPLRYYDGGIVDPEDECVIGGFGIETIVPLKKKYAIFVDYGPDAQQKIFDDKQEAEKEYETLVKESDGIPVYLCEVIKQS